MSKVRFSRKGQFACMEQAYIDPKTKQPTNRSRVICRGPRYSFLLEKEDKDLPFVVKSLTSRSQPESHGIFIHLDNFIFRVCGAPYNFSCGILPELVRDDAFVVKEMKEMRDGDANLVSVEYEYNKPEGRSHRGTIRLDPALDWAIVSTDIQARDAQGRIHENTTYTSTSVYERYGDRIALRMFSQKSSHDHKPLEVHDYELGGVSFEPLAEAAFTLKAFGVPEIPVYEGQGTSLFSPKNWPFWACLTLTILAFLALRLMARKRSV